jgi:hypothetical protein
VELISHKADNARGSDGNAQEPSGDNQQSYDANDGPDESAENASFNNDIGGPNDPGRVAEDKFVARNNENPHDSGRPGPRDTEVDNDGQYKSLNDEAAETPSSGTSDRVGDEQRKEAEAVSSETGGSVDKKQNKVKEEVSEAADGPVGGQQDDKGTSGDSTDVHPKKYAPRPGGDTGEDIVDTGDAKLPMPEQPPRASDWQSMDARNVNV